ncbi:hypothetical protein B0H13DRAFT_1851099 [Mycena leptocephala]|nr:hypothetical protein B0H13DRAFT_1851099 [Mycena leptocephala]
MADDDAAPLTAEELATKRRCLRARGAGISVQTDNTAGEINDFSSPTFKSIPMWYARVKSATLDLIVDGKFEAEDLVKLSSHGAGPREKARPMMWFPSEGFVAPDSYPEELSESGLPRGYLKAFPSIVPLLDAWSVYTGIRALCDPAASTPHFCSSSPRSMSGMPGLTKLVMHTHRKHGTFC